MTLIRLHVHFVLNSQVIEEPCDIQLQRAQLKLPIAMDANDNNETGDLSCTEPGCVKSFRKQSSLEKHIAIGNHFYHEARSTTDVAMEIWASKCSESVSFNRSNVIDDFSNESVEENNVPREQIKAGWALKSDRKFVRFSTDVKQFVRNIFEEGERSGKKANPVTVSSQIRNDRDEHGRHTFCPNDWISAQQVRSLFAQFHIKMMKENTRNTKRPRMELAMKTEEDEDLNEVLRELDAVEMYNTVNVVTAEICEL